MAENPTTTQNVVIAFKMADPEGTAAVRVAAGHAQRVGEAWCDLGDQMFAMADAFDALTAEKGDDDA